MLIRRASARKTVGAQLRYRLLRINEWKVRRNISIARADRATRAPLQMASEMTLIGRFDSINHSCDRRRNEIGRDELS